MSRVAQGVEAVVLCGGLGSRLQAVSGDLPKVLVPVAGRPFLEWVLAWLTDAGVARVILAAGHRGQVIRDYVARRPGDLRIGVVQESRPLGTAGAVRFAWSQARVSTPFLALNGDSLCRLDTAALCASHLARGRPPATIAVTRVADAAEYGTVTLDSAGNITAFAEKTGVPGPGLVNAGVYLLESSIFTGIRDDAPRSLERDVFPALGVAPAAFVTDAPVWDMGTPERLVEVAAALAT